MSAKSTPVDKEKLLRECTLWMYNTKYSENPAEDKGPSGKPQNNKPGNKEVIMGQHGSGGYCQGKWDEHVWIFPGYFNTLLKPPTMDGTPKIKRQVTIGTGDRIFCVVGSSTAGEKWEQARLIGRGINKGLIEIARDIQNTYQQLKLTVDGVVTELEKVEVEDVEVKVPQPDTSFNPPKQHPLVKYYDGMPILADDTTNTATVAHVALIGPLKPGPHTIDLYARSPGDEPTGDIQYEIDVRYEVKVE